MLRLSLVSAAHFLCVFTSVSCAFLCFWWYIICLKTATTCWGVVLWDSCFSLLLSSASSDTWVQIPEMHMWEHTNTMASHEHSFTSIHRSINSMNRSFSWGLLLRPNPLHRLLWYLPGPWCSPELLCALPSLDGSPQAHHMLLLTNLRAYSHSWVFPVSHLELGSFVWSLARTWGLSTLCILIW